MKQRKVQRFIPKHLASFVVAGILLLCLSGCKDRFEGVILIESGEVVEVGAGSAVMRGIVKDIGEGIRQYGYCWNQTGSPEYANGSDKYIELGSCMETGSFECEINGLYYDTEYIIRIYATDGEEIIYGEELHLSTDELIQPSICFGTVDIYTNSIQASSEIEMGNFYQSIDQWGYCWSVDPDPDIYDEKTEGGSIDKEGSYTNTITGLVAETEYYISGYMILDETVWYSTAQTFTTYGNIPQLSDIYIGKYVPFGVECMGNISYPGNEKSSITSHGFCWSESAAPSLADNKTELGEITGTEEFTSTIDGLEDNRDCRE